MGKIAFGGGCHWCTEAIFQSIKGVARVEQGWISSSEANSSSPSEAVIIHFNSQKISLDTLIEIHLFTHSSTSNHQFRDKYRSAVYTFSDEQSEIALRILKEKEKLFKEALITQVYPFARFTLNQEKYLNYYKKNPEKPFCKTRIEPKLKILLQMYGTYVPSLSFDLS